MSRSDFAPLAGGAGGAAAAEASASPPRRSSAAPHNRAPPLGYNPTYGAAAVGGGAAGSTAGAGPSRADSGHGSSLEEEADRVPLNREFDEFRQSFTDAIGNIGTNDGPRRPAGQEPPLWEQGRQRSRNMVWI